jgi:hypothetical protein
MNDDHRPFDILVRCTGTHIDPDGDHKHALLWAYDKEHPAAVELVFVPELISWTFSRDLLFTAAVQGAPAGEGDVLIQPQYSTTHGSHLVLTLRSADGREDFILDRRTAQKFLYATFDLVQLGEEDYTVQVDAFLLEMQS